MDKKVLIVEDENSIRGFLRINFQRNDFIVIEASSAEEGLRKAILEKPHIAVLDVMLPGMDGFSLCKNLRGRFPEMGIIMLTARNQDMDKIMGLEQGADDYLVKPFNPLELMLRVKAIIRRIEGKLISADEEIIHRYDFKLNLYSQKLYKNEKEICVTPKEYLLFKLFIENPGKAFTRDELLNIVWGYDFFGDPKIVDVNIRRLRTKIEENPSAPKYIETVWGTGYRWNDEKEG
ncbi:response regulator transcription factor [Clostridium sp. MSJ-4]|uniref:Stage 0 sporulation protein A homolog n=1 Tax=Clostridium simiarum TaxID=2841506 RepID=A0ABS6F3W8_9CLOT|nr:MULTISPECIES: response regulator transcription factor [Clostridium]MBU5592953.1 response regulator transcription factor [Clostridium simiarum]